MTEHLYRINVFDWSPQMWALRTLFLKKLYVLGTFEDILLFNYVGDNSMNITKKKCQETPKFKEKLIIYFFA